MKLNKEKLLIFRDKYEKKQGGTQEKTEFEGLVIWNY